MGGETGTGGIDHKRIRGLDYSLRRYYVDQFHFRHVPEFPAGSIVLDLGGNRVSKRGVFDIEAYDLRVVYADVSTAKKPHVQADAAWLPFRDECFDGVICSEVLEHVPDPRVVLQDVHRVLKRHGRLLVCIPFLNRIHGDPQDYGRYTDSFLRETLRRIGFREVIIERQGLFWSVLVDMVRDMAYAEAMRHKPRSAFLRRLVAFAIGKCKQRAIQWDRRHHEDENSLVHAFTTGFGVTAVRI
ncbi:MAG: class I SAM-dependent methyltransferase [Desulfomonile sp.]|nr:class I SAM-dependent methyltransferase [Desulfomonile sp.]